METTTATTDATPEDDKVMSFWEHLDELRSRLTRAMIAYVVAMFVAWYFKDQMLKVLCEPFMLSWHAANVPGEWQLHFAAPGDMFLAYFKLSMLAGLGIAAPIIFWQLWAFIAPGLYKNEKRYAILVVLASTAFFLGGAYFGWRVAFPISFGYFLGLTGEAAAAGVRIQPTVMMGEYLDFVGQMLLAFGIIFELPLFLTALSVIGIVNYLTLYRFGRWFVLIASIVGAVLSPPDTTSMVVMTVPLIVLYFVSVGLAYVFGQKPTPEQIERDRRWREEKRIEREARRAEKRAEAKAAAEAKARGESDEA
ncbi:MAG TPA: twin-arginine translocase subunit TatC [Polyangiaceae bacterium]|nr:twin-arginine translocase subunit TatC [Polyangiaceae bacterium]